MLVLSRWLFYVAKNCDFQRAEIYFIEQFLFFIFSVSKIKRVYFGSVVSRS